MHGIEEVRKKDLLPLSEAEGLFSHFFKSVPCFFPIKICRYKLLTCLCSENKAS